MSLQSVAQLAVQFLFSLRYSLNPYNYFLNPMLLLLIIPAAVFLWVFLKREFVKIVEDPEVHRRRKLVQKVMFFSRLVIILLLLIALASPFRESSQVIEGDPVITVLTDTSNSMAALSAWDPAIVERLQNKIDISVQPAGSVETSDIGDAVLNSLGPYQSILLVSDGQVTKGADLGDVALFAQKLNATINLIKLNPKESDVAIAVEGPGKTKADVDTKFSVLIKRSNFESSVPVKVSVDGVEIMNEPTASSVLYFNYSFPVGTHEIIASVNQQDFFPQNNIYYKTVKAVPMPKVIFLTHDTNVPLLQLLRQSFDVEASATFPDFQELDSSYAVITDNMDISDLESHTETLSNYITQGNGMLTIGGGNSLDKTYRATQFETLLPGFVGKAAKKDSDINVVMLIDVSGSTSSSLVNAQGESEKKVDVMKALAADVIRNSLGSTVKVGAIAYSQSASVVSDLSYLNDKKGLIDRISQLIDKQTGGTKTAIGLNSAIGMLANAKGSKNIILLSDGANQDRNYAIESAKLAANKGIKIYSVQVARVSEFSSESTDAENMMAYADITNGIYFGSDGAQRLRVLFGDNDKLPPQDFPSLFVVDDNHFITQNLKVDAKISGYNDVVPKIPARLLMTTTNGEPVLTAWRLGLGRVALWSSDDGSRWSGDTLGEQASEVWSRMGDWVIGEPDRKMAEKVDIPDTRINTPTPVLVKSKGVPRADNIGLYKVDQDTYAGTITPNEIGFQSVLGAEFAVNAPFEYENIGISKELRAIVASTGGKIFEPNDVDGILKFAKANAKRTVISQEGIRYPWVIAALILFLLEIFIRRYLRKE